MRNRGMSRSPTRTTENARCKGIACCDGLYRLSLHLALLPCAGLHAVKNTTVRCLKNEIKSQRGNSRMGVLVGRVLWHRRVGTSLVGWLGKRRPLRTMQGAGCTATAASQHATSRARGRRALLWSAARCV